MSSSIESMKERVAALGGQIRSIKQGGASSSSSGDLESIQAELKDLKARLAKAEKEQKEEKEKNKIVIKVPKVCSLTQSKAGESKLNDAFRWGIIRAPKTIIRLKCCFVNNSSRLSLQTSSCTALLR